MYAISTVSKHQVDKDSRQRVLGYKTKLAHGKHTEDR